MNWKMKARVQSLVATLPWSDAIYYAGQRAVGRLRGGGASPLESFELAAGMLRWFTAVGRELAGKRVFELGTGRNLNLPIALWLCGADRVVTADLNRYLSETLVLKSIDYVRRQPEHVRKAFAVESERPRFRERLKRLTEFRGSVRDLLRLTNVTYLAPVDTTKLPVPAHTFDFHVSCTVFEHVRPETLVRILIEARRIVAPHGLLSHFIDPSDHFAHTDASIPSINFLQFSEREWSQWAGNKYGYHNRLRGCQYVALFERAGFDILRTHRVVDRPAETLLRTGFRVDQRFQDMSAEDLAVSWFMVIATVAEARPEATPGERRRTSDDNVEHGANDMAKRPDSAVGRSSLGERTCSALTSSALPGG
jgi:SAM-dependent methyltransferase